MSKITSKNLSYDTTLPPFLARLQANNNSSDGRHEFAAARPKKIRTEADEEEDEPVFFDEDSGETLTRRDWEAREKDRLEEEGKVEKGDNGVKLEGGKEKEKEKVANIGGSRKRKVGKVVGRDGEGEQEGEGEGKDKSKSTGIEGKNTTAKSKSETEIKKSDIKGKTAKAKKIKLSFGDDD